MDQTNPAPIRNSLPRIPTPGESMSRLLGISTGYYELDDSTHGLQGGFLYALMGRSEIGHQSFALNVAANAVLREDKKVLILTLGTNQEAVSREMICTAAKVWQRDSGRAEISDDRQFAALFEASRRLALGDRLLINQQGFRRASELRRHVSELVRARGVDLVLAMHLNRLLGASWESSDGSLASAVEQGMASAAISQDLKSLARELTVPVLATVDLRKHSSVPTMRDIEPYGYLENDADVVLVLHREDYYKPWIERWGIADLYVVKNKNGENARFELAYLKPWKAFENLAVDYASMR